MEHDVRDARVFADGQHSVPRFAAIGGLVETASAGGRPERSLRGDVDDVGVARIDDDLRDVLRLFQPDVFPALPAVDRFVDAVTHRDRALAVVLARSNPDYERVVRVDGHAADRERLLIIEDRREAGAGVRRLPDAASRGRDIPDPRVARIDGQIDDAAGRECRSEGTQLKACEGLFAVFRFFFFLLLSPLSATFPSHLKTLIVTPINPVFL